MYMNGGTAPKDQTVQWSSVVQYRTLSLSTLHRTFFQPSYSPRHVPWPTQPPILSGTANDQ